MGFWKVSFSCRLNELEGLQMGVLKPVRELLQQGEAQDGDAGPGQPVLDRGWEDWAAEETWVAGGDSGVTSGLYTIPCIS